MIDRIVLMRVDREEERVRRGTFGRLGAALAAGWLVALLLPGCGGGASPTASASQLEARLAASASPVVGEPLMLDATASVVPTTGTLQYAWAVKDPAGETVGLADAAGTRPYFVPATAGTYGIELRITATAPSGASAQSPLARLDVAVAASSTPTVAEVRARVRSLAAAASAPEAPDGSAPTIAVGDPGAASRITGSRLLAWTRPEFVYNGDVVQAGSVYPDYLFGANRAVSYSAALRGGTYATIDFSTDATEFEILQKGLGAASNLWVLVDGRLARNAATTLPSDGELYLTRVTFGSKATRRVRLVMTSPYFGGIRVGAADSVTRPVPGTRLRAMFLGDSITEGTAGQSARASFAALAAERLGWHEAWISGVGATGYLAAPAPKLTLRQRLATDVIAYKPHVLVIAAGVNDLGFTDAQIEAEAATLFDEIQAALPDTLVFVTGPVATLNRVRGGVNAAIKAAVGTRANFIWVPNVDEPWLTGTGTVSRPRGDGNADQYISADITHPTPAGIDYLAGRLADFIKQAVN
ncbi:MAG: SGNH/GDSL hydrolase family protein [Rubrivivax sp.]|nr:SGNH/GDSL hydrolase family protein [Rubrivivax sp.]